MKKAYLLFVLIVLLLSGCGGGNTTATNQTDIQAEENSSAIPTFTSEPEEQDSEAENEPENTSEDTVVEGMVTSVENEGPGTLREMINQAQPGDTITFSPEVFPTEAPATIYLNGPLGIPQGGITIDASNAGVIIDGSNGPESGLIIESSDNAVMGIRFTNFQFCGIEIKAQGWDSDPDASANNVIGGDPEMGDGPYGQGNSFVNNQNGLCISNGADQNKVIGNFIGVEADLSPAGNYQTGVLIQAGSDNNQIGPGNIIANNGENGVLVDGSEYNIITQNAIYNHQNASISLINGGNHEWFSQIEQNSIQIDCENGMVSAEIFPSPIQTLEVFSGSIEGPAFYEGSLELNAEPNENGDDVRTVFTFEKGAAFDGNYIYFTGHTPDGNTTNFTAPVSCETGNIEGQAQGGNSFVDQWLISYSEIWVEGVDAMAENQAGQFGAGSIKNYNEESHVISFESEGGSIWTPLNTLLDEWDGAVPGGNQAILIKFQIVEPTTEINFNLLGFTNGNLGPEFNINLSTNNVPQFNSLSQSEPFSSGELVLETGKWYYNLMAIDSEGNFRTAVWEADNSENQSTYSIAFDNDEFKNKSWKFVIGAYQDALINIEEYRVYTFEGFTE